MAETRLTLLIDSQPAARAVASLALEGARPAGFRTHYSCTRAAGSANNLVVFSTASHLERVASCVSSANKEHRLAALVVFNDISPNWIPYILHRAGLRTLRNTLVHSDDQLPSRILNAWAIGAEKDLIADAAVIGERLVVRTCAFEELSLGFDAFPALRSILPEHKSHFEIDSEGYFLYWPDSDAHLDASDVRFASDPDAGRAAQVETLRYNTALGSALKHLRESAGLRQDQIPGMSDRHVRRVESGVYLTLDSVEAFARALALPVDDLLESLGNSSAGVAASQRAIPGIATKRRGEAMPRSRFGAAISGHLQLAADSAAEDVQIWHFSLPPEGALSGTLQHNLADDTLYFVLQHPPASFPTAQLRLSGVTTDSQQFSSDPFTPRAGLSVILTHGKGVLPGDVATLALGPADEL